MLHLCPRVSRAWGCLSALSLPRVLARSLGLGCILLRPPPRAGHSAWFAHLVPCSERPAEWPLARSTSLACKVGLGVVTESSEPVSALLLCSGREPEGLRRGGQGKVPSPRVRPWSFRKLPSAARRCVLVGMARGHLPGLSLLPSHLANSCSRSVLSQGFGGTGSLSRDASSGFEVAGVGSWQPLELGFWSGGPPPQAECSFL